MRDVSVLTVSDYSFQDADIHRTGAVAGLPARRIVDVVGPSEGFTFGLSVDFLQYKFLNRNYSEVALLGACSSVSYFAYRC